MDGLSKPTRALILIALVGAVPLGILGIVFLAMGGTGLGLTLLLVAFGNYLMIGTALWARRRYGR